MNDEILLTVEEIARAQDDAVLAFNRPLGPDNDLELGEYTSRYVCRAQVRKALLVAFDELSVCTQHGQPRFDGEGDDYCFYQWDDSDPHDKRWERDCAACRKNWIEQALKQVAGEGE